MIKLVIFDLDGVIIDLKDCHYESLNEALRDFSNQYVIEEEEHYKFYDGLPTKQKLKMLSKYKNLPESSYDTISNDKQTHTLKFIYEKVKPSENISRLFEELKNHGYKTCIASNSVSNTIYAVLTKLKILHLVDHVFSNQDVKFSKPNPEIYFRAISHFGVLPQESLIVEDSPFGLEAAYQSGSHVLRVNNSFEVTIQNVFSEIKKHDKKNSTYCWRDKKMNVLIPMAGAGSRFESAGYTLPKPLIDVCGKPMIQRVVENLNVDAKFVFLVQKAHEEKYQISQKLNSMNLDCSIVYVDGLTEGAACTALLAESFIDNDEPLLIANSDQYVEWDSQHFYYQLSSQKHVDASMLTFSSTHPKWSFASLDDDGYVNKVAEKEPISNIATVGVYYWRKGKDFVKYAKSMIQKNLRVNNEFYIAPVFNEAISDKKKVTTFEISKMWGLGTPEDLTYFLENGKNLLL